MSTTTLSHRDRAVLRAVAAGRCRDTAGSLTVDGVGCCDQFVAARLIAAGLIDTLVDTATGAFRLTESGRAALAR